MSKNPRDLLKIKQCVTLRIKFMVAMWTANSIGYAAHIKES